MKFTLAQVTAVKPLTKHRLALTFSDGASGIYDCAPLLWGEAFEPLKDPKFFASVFLDHGAPAWPNGADLDSGVLRQAIAAPRPPKSSRIQTLKIRYDKSTVVAEDPAPYGDQPGAAPLAQSQSNGRPARSVKKRAGGGASLSARSTSSSSGRTTQSSR